MPAGTGVCVVKTVRERARSSASSTAAPRSQLLARELERGERRVALVHVDDAGLDAERAQRAHAADAEQDVLRQPRARVADVEPRRDPARSAGVLGPVGVEQEQRHAADVDAPDLGGHRRGRRSGRSIVSGSPPSSGDERGGQPLGVGGHPVLVLPAAGVDALAEVALAVHQPDRDERQRAVGGLLDRSPASAPSPPE